MTRTRLRLAGSAALLVGVLVLLVLLVLLAPRTARAQGQASQPLGGTAFLDFATTGAGVRNLRFGDVTPGSAVSVDAAAGAGAACSGGCQSGLFTYQNVSTFFLFRYLQVTFPSLPTVLTGPGGATMPVSFRAKGCLVNRTTGVDYYCFANAAITSGGTYRMQVNSPAPGGAVAQRDANLYVGGTLTAAAAQRAGVYSGTVTAVFAYTIF
ncbi:MAG: DUF4402 domain-containing protein [Georgenia sp.]